MRRFKPRTTLGLAFVALTILITIAYSIVYISEVKEALALDPHSYACTQDSMMKQVCADPYGSSVFWSLFELGILYWPLIAAWVIVGLRIAWKRARSTKTSHTGRH